MITLGTGLPGNGKTLFMLWYLQQKAKRETREVYYYNIKGLNIEALGNWQECDPLKWFDLPHGSIVVIDECQDIFGKKPNGATLPEHYTKLNTHRHLGIDLFLISQHPGLLDNSVRLLVGQHFHSIRKFGLERATIYEWSSCNAAPQLASSHKNAVTLKWAFPKEVYTWYKSAEVHTVKKSIPMKLVLALLFVVAVPSLGYYALDRFQKRGVEQSEAAQAPVALSAAPGAVRPGGTAGAVLGYEDPVADAQQFLWERTPRLEGLPETAPRYDQLTQAVRVPIPAICIQKGSVRDGDEITCKCFSQQATPMDIEFNMCMSIARNGRFMDFDPEPSKRDEAVAQRSAQVLERHPDLPMVDTYGAPRVVAFNETEAARSQGIRPRTNTDTGPPNPASRSALARQR